MVKLADYNQFGGANWESAAVRNLLAHKGVVAPHTGEPFSEAMVLGIGGGIGIAYWMFEFSHGPFLYIGTRFHGDLLGGFAGRLGIAVRNEETGSKKAAVQNLISALESGQPAIVWCDPAGLPYNGLPADLLKWMAVVPVVVYGYDESQVQLSDLASVPLVISPDDLSLPRGAQPAAKNRVTLLEPPAQLAELGAAIRGGHRRLHQRLDRAANRQLRAEVAGEMG